MGKGIRSFDERQRRKVRIQNHIAKDLRKSEFRMRRVESGKDRGEKYKNWERFDIEE